MRAAERVALAILVAGNLLLWGDQLQQAEPRSFDFDGFRRQVGAIFADVELSPQQFDDEVLLPEDYLSLECPADADRWLSLYAGYFPNQGLLANEPHDPQDCYAALGWQILDGPTTLELEPPGWTAPMPVSRIEVTQGDDTRLAFYWRHERGALPGAPGGWLAEYWRRWLTGRSDLVWVRVELDRSATEEPLSTDWIRRLAATAEAAAAAMR